MKITDLLAALIEAGYTRAGHEVARTKRGVLVKPGILEMRPATRLDVWAEPADRLHGDTENFAVLEVQRRLGFKIADIQVYNGRLYMRGVEGAEVSGDSSEVQAPPAPPAETDAAKGAAVEEARG